MTTKTRYSYPKLAAAKKEAFRLCGHYKGEVRSTPFMKDGKRIGSNLFFHPRRNGDEWNSYCKEQGYVRVGEYTHYIKEDPVCITENHDRLLKFRIRKQTETLTNDFIYTSYSLYRQRPQYVNGKWKWRTTSTTFLGSGKDAEAKGIPNWMRNTAKIVGNMWETVPIVESVSLTMTDEELIAMDMFTDERYDLVKTIPGLFIVE